MVVKKDGRNLGNFHVGDEQSWPIINCSCYSGIIKRCEMFIHPLNNMFTT